MITTDTSCSKSVTGFSSFKMAVPALGNCEFVVSEEALYEESFSVSGCSHSILNNHAVATLGKLDHSLRTELQEAVNRQLLKEIFKSRATETSQVQWTGEMRVSARLGLAWNLFSGRQCTAACAKWLHSRGSASV